MMGHISNASSYTIDSNWMSRVKDIVDYCISKDLYVILNDHWDGGWLEDSFGDVSDATVEANSEKLKTLWKQIAENFSGYDEHLLFAGLNEPGMENGNPNSSSVAALIKYEQAFIDAVRATEGNNSGRILIVQGPKTDIDESYKLYDVDNLTDWVEDRLMVEVHFYFPWQFCGLTEDASWGKMWYYWGSGNDGSDYSRNTDSKYTENYVKSQMAKMKTKYYDKGYPVVLGEYGANYRFTGDSKHNASIKAFYKAVNQYAVANGCIPYAWDTNYAGYPSMTIIDRANLSIFNSYMMDGITAGVKAASWPN